MTKLNDGDQSHKWRARRHHFFIGSCAIVASQSTPATGAGRQRSRRFYSIGAARAQRMNGRVNFRLLHRPMNSFSAFHAPTLGYFVTASL